MDKTPDLKYAVVDVRESQKDRGIIGEIVSRHTTAENAYKKYNRLEPKSQNHSGFARYKVVELTKPKKIGSEVTFSDLVDQGGGAVAVMPPWI